MKARLFACGAACRPMVMIALVCGVVGSLGAQPIELLRIGQIDAANETGTVAYDATSHSILSTNGELKIQLHSFGDGTNLTLALEVDLSTSLAEPRFVSGVAADPGGRGFGVATLIPTANDSVLGVCPDSSSALFFMGLIY